MSADHLPRPAILPCPHASIPIRSADPTACNFDCKVCAKSRNRNVFSDTPDAKLFRLVLPKADGARGVRIEILSFCAKLCGWAREKKVFADQRVECFNVCGQLSGPYSRLELGYLGIGFSEKDLFHQCEIIVGHCGSSKR